LATIAIQLYILPSLSLPLSPPLSQITSSHDSLSLSLSFYSHLSKVGT
jgi:hypothetical protein